MFTSRETVLPPSLLFKELNMKNGKNRIQTLLGEGIRNIQTKNHDNRSRRDIDRQTVTNEMASCPPR